MESPTTTIPWPWMVTTLAIIGAAMALLSQYFSSSKAKHEADKAKAEADKARTEAATAVAELEKVRGELEVAKKQLAALQESEQLEGLGLQIRDYAEKLKRQLRNHNL